MNEIITTSVQDLVNFVLGNRGNKVFKNWTEEQIQFEIIRAMDDNSMVYIKADYTERILGLVTGRKLISDNGTKIMHISAALTVAPGILRIMYKVFRKLYPDYKVMGGNRNGRLFVWDLNKVNKYLERL
jgi:hypothetical protein